jgi:hypothetical protein
VETRLLVERVEVVGDLLLGRRVVLADLDLQGGSGGGGGGGVLGRGFRGNLSARRGEVRGASSLECFHTLLGHLTSVDVRSSMSNILHYEARSSAASERFLCMLTL